MINVLWIDDEHNNEEMVPFTIAAEHEGFILSGFSSFEEGFEHLIQNMNVYDLILLDALFFESKVQEAGTEDESGLGMAIAKINELKSKKAFPWFVLSGKDQFTQGENPILKANKARCFDKTKPSDLEELFSKMRTAAETSDEYTLKHKYEQLLSICGDKYLGQKQFDRIFYLIHYVEGRKKIDSPEDMLTPLRKVFEAVFHRLGEIGIIPDSILTGTGWINGASRFLSNRHNEFLHLKEIVHPLVAENVYRLLSITQDGSHNEGILRLRADEYIKQSSADFFYRSCVFLLFDLLIWLRGYIDQNPDKEKNQAMWENKLAGTKWLPGEVIKIADNGWGTFQPETGEPTLSIPPWMVSQYGLVETLQIKVVTEPSPDGKKKHIKLIDTYK